MIDAPPPPYSLYSNPPSLCRMTRSGRASGAACGCASNLAPDRTGDFADYLVTVVRHFADEHGLVFQ